MVLKAPARAMLKLLLFFSEGRRMRLKSPRMIQELETDGAKLSISATKSRVRV
jgi:hypothetical protein